MVLEKELYELEFYQDIYWKNRIGTGNFKSMNWLIILILFFTELSVTDLQHKKQLDDYSIKLLKTNKYMRFYGYYLVTQDGDTLKFRVDRVGKEFKIYEVNMWRLKAKLENNWKGITRLIQKRIF